MRALIALRAAFMSGRWTHVRIARMPWGHTQWTLPELVSAFPWGTGDQWALVGGWTRGERYFDRLHTSVGVPRIMHTSCAMPQASGARARTSRMPHGIGDAALGSLCPCNVWRVGAEASATAGGTRTRYAWAAAGTMRRSLSATAAEGPHAARYTPNEAADID